MSQHTHLSEQTRSSDWRKIVFAGHLVVIYGGAKLASGVLVGSNMRSDPVPTAFTILLGALTMALRLFMCSGEWRSRASK
jgi:hypothetical protein